MSRRWFKGDTHLHTTNSDGILHQYELIDRCKALGLDWIIITDHNFNTVKESYSSDGLTIIQGQEVTGEQGHVNVWGAKVPFETPYDLTDINAYKKIMTACKENGATVSVNHPFCSKCGFHMNLDDFPMDCVEVWNTVQHSDNVKNLEWWVKKLDEGIKIGAVGGSDFHRDYGLRILSLPTTITYAKSNSPEDILESLREGRAVVTNSANSSMLYLNVGDACLGDTIELCDTLTGTIRATKLLPHFTLKVFNNHKVIYEHRASGYEKEHIASFAVREKGYIRAEINYEFSPLLKKIYKQAESKFLNCSGDVPELFWAFTNPIYIS